MAKLDRLSRAVVDAGRLLKEARSAASTSVPLDLAFELSRRRTSWWRSDERGGFKLKIAARVRSPVWEE